MQQATHSRVARTCHLSSGTASFSRMSTEAVLWLSPSTTTLFSAAWSRSSADRRIPSVFLPTRAGGVSESIRHRHRRTPDGGRILQPCQLGDPDLSCAPSGANAAAEAASTKHSTMRLMCWRHMRLCSQYTSVYTEHSQVRKWRYVLESDGRCRMTASWTYLLKASNCLSYSRAVERSGFPLVSAGAAAAAPYQLPQRFLGPILLR